MCIWGFLYLFWQHAIPIWQKNKDLFSNQRNLLTMGVAVILPFCEYHTNLNKPDLNLAFISLFLLKSQEMPQNVMGNTKGYGKRQFFFRSIEFIQYY